MYLKKVLAGSIAVSLASSLYAYEMKPVGFKAMGMGGTGVASTRGSLVGYYNPALLRMSDYTTEVSMNLGANLRETNLVDNIDTLSNIDFDATLDRIGANAKTGNRDITYNNITTSISGTSNLSQDITNIETAINTLKSIGQSNALQVGANLSLAAQMGDSLAIGIYANVDAGLQAVIDTNRMELIFKAENSTSVPSSTDGDASNDYYSYSYSTDTYANKTKSEYESSSLEYAVDNGMSYIDLYAMILTEIPISYAKAYDWNSGFWSFGFSIKPMALEAYKKKISLGTDSGDATDNFDSDVNKIEYDSTFGIDFGIAYIPKGTDVTIGLVGKNLNSPTFDVSKVGSSVSSASDYEIDPYFRAGVSYPIWNNNIEFALDVDLQKSETIIPGEDTQMVGAGIELHPASWFALRLGAMQDMASEKYDDGTILTAGVGFGLKWFQFDFSVMASTETGEYDGDEIPRYAAANLSLLSRWGDGYNQKQPPKYEGDYTENVAPTKILTDEKIEKMEKELDKETNEKNSNYNNVVDQFTK